MWDTGTTSAPGSHPAFPLGTGSRKCRSSTAGSLGRRVTASGGGGGAPAGDDDKLELVLAVSNVGAVAGAETVQVYVADEKSRLPRPHKELVAFKKLFLEAGEKKHLRMGIDRLAVG